MTGCPVVWVPRDQHADLVEQKTASRVSADLGGDCGSPCVSHFAPPDSAMTVAVELPPTAQHVAWPTQETESSGPEPAGNVSSFQDFAPSVVPIPSTPDPVDALAASPTIWHVLCVEQSIELSTLPKTFLGKE